MPVGTSKVLSTVLAVCFCIVSTMYSSTASCGNAYSEAAIKAAYIYRFTTYIDWPVENNLSKFIVTVIGDDEVADNLTELLSARSIKNLPSQVRKIKKINELTDTQVLYIGPGFKGNLSHVIAGVKMRPVLIVTSQPDALTAGSAINFLQMGDRIRFEASTTTAEQLGLRIAPELLSVAVHVSSNRPQRESNCAVTKTPELMNTRCDE